MIEWFGRLFDTSDFVPRSQCGNWTSAWIWVHVGSDLFIWLAYLSIPILLLFFMRSVRQLPYPRLIVLFSIFILSCGIGHLIEALMFQYPLYRLAGAWKVVTAVSSWVTVIALIPLIPRLMDWLKVSPMSMLGQSGGIRDTTLRQYVVIPAKNHVQDYMIAILAAVLALLIRAAINPIVHAQHFYLVSLLSVVFVSWQCGFGPAIVTLLLNLFGKMYFFVDETGSLNVVGLNNQLAMATFFFCGICCAALGEAQHRARRESLTALSVALERKDELQVEIARRHEMEYSLRQREQELVELNTRLSASQVRTAELLGQVESLVHNAPIGIAFFDPKERLVQSNRVFAEMKKTTIRAPLGSNLAQKFPQFSTDVINELREVYKSRVPVIERRVEFQVEHLQGVQVWHVSAFPMYSENDHIIGLGVIGQDRTEQELSARAIQESESRFRTLAAAVPQMVWIASTDGNVEYFNSKWYEYTGYTSEQSLGWGWAEVLHPEDRERAQARWTHSVETGEEYEIEYRLRCGDGNYHWFLGRALPETDPTGYRVRWFGTCTDIDDTKIMAEELADRMRVTALRAELAEILAEEDPDNVASLRRCCEALVRHTEANAVAIWTLDAGSESLSLQATAWNTPLNEQPMACVPMYLSALGQIARSPHPTIHNQVALTTENEDLAWALNAGLTSYAGYPLVIAGKLYGLLVLHTHVELKRRLHEDLVPIAEGIAQSIDRMQATELRRKSEERFRTLTEAVPQIVWTANPGGELTFFNRRWEDYTGLEPLQGRIIGWQNVIHPDDAEGFLTAWNTTIAQAQDRLAEVRFVAEVRLCTTTPEEYRWMLATAVPLRDPVGNIMEWVGSLTDIEYQKQHAEILERKVIERTAELHAVNGSLLQEIEIRQQAETKIRRQQEFLDAILENVADGIVACDEKGELILFNRATREFHGLNALAMPQSDWSKHYALYHVDNETPLTADEIPLVRAYHGERVRDYEFVIAPKDLPRRIVVANGRPLIDEHNHNLGAVVSMRDVTEQKKSEKQLRLAITELHRANTELSRSNHELEQFAYIASHDLQEPLRKIQAFGDRLKTKYREELPDTGKEYIERMQSAAGRMRKLIDDLLTFSRVTTHVRPMAPVDLRKLMAEVLSDLSERLETTRGQIHVGDLPEIDGDNSQFRQLFQNLIANALKFHKPDMPPVVEISSEFCEVPTPGDPTVSVPATRIRVKDHGIGFEEKYLDRIFQVFQRLHGRDEYEGTGVGLAICRKIVERHGGILTAESQLGVGAEFIITVPLRQPQPEENPEYLPLRTDN